MTAFKMPPLPATETTTSDHKDGCGEPAYLPEVVARYGKEVYAAALDAAAAIIQARIDNGTPFDSPVEHLEAVKAEILALKKPAEVPSVDAVREWHDSRGNLLMSASPAETPWPSVTADEQRAGMAGPVVLTGGAWR